MIASVTPNRVVVFAVGAFVFYWVLALFVPAALLRDVFNSLAFGTAVIIAMTWLPSAARAVKEGASSGAWQLVLGIFLLWFVAMSQRLYAIAFNYYDRPDAWAASAVTGFWPFSYMIAGLLFIMAPGVRADGMRLSAIWALVAAFSIGSLLAGILIGASISTG